MLDHVSIGVKDIEASKRFYDATLKPLGYVSKYAKGTDAGYGKEAIQLWLGQTDKPVKEDMASGLHFCFVAPTRKSVDDFHAAGEAVRRAQGNGANATAATKESPKIRVPRAMASSSVYCAGRLAEAAPSCHRVVALRRSLPLSRDARGGKRRKGRCSKPRPNGWNDLCANGAPPICRRC